MQTNEDSDLPEDNQIYKVLSVPEPAAVIPAESNEEVEPVETDESEDPTNKDLPVTDNVADNQLTVNEVLPVPEPAEVILAYSNLEVKQSLTDQDYVDETGERDDAANRYLPVLDSVAVNQITMDEVLPEPVRVVPAVSNGKVKHVSAGESKERNDGANRDDAVADSVTDNQPTVLPKPVEVVPAAGTVEVDQGLDDKPNVGQDEDSVELSNDLSNNEALVKFFSKMKNISAIEEERVGKEGVVTPDRTERLTDEGKTTVSNQLRTPVNPAPSKR